MTVHDSDGADPNDGFVCHLGRDFKDSIGVLMLC